MTKRTDDVKDDASRGKQNKKKEKKKTAKKRKTKVRDNMEKQKAEESWQYLRRKDDKMCEFSAS